MSAPPPPPDRFDTFVGRARKILSLLMGFGVLAWETAVDHVDRPWLLAAALGLIFLPAASWAEILAARWGARTQPPPSPPPRDDGGE